MKSYSTQICLAKPVDIILNYFAKKKEALNPYASLLDSVYVRISQIFTTNIKDCIMTGSMYLNSTKYTVPLLSIHTHLPHDIFANLLNKFFISG